jgi:hypothetical protein
MKTSDTRAFANQLLVCFLVTVCCSGSVGMGIVWMRHQISVTANINRILAARITEVERNCEATKALVATEQDPDVLRRRNAEWNLGMAPESDRQVVRVTEDPVQQLVALRNQELFTADRALPVVSFQLALKN